MGLRLFLQDLKVLLGAAGVEGGDMDLALPGSPAGLGTNEKRPYSLPLVNPPNLLLPSTTICIREYRPSLTWNNEKRPSCKGMERAFVT